MSWLKVIRAWFKTCDHNYVVVHSDNAVHLERCTKCQHLDKYGG